MKIVFEDNDILIVNKDAFLTVNKSDTTIHEKTVQDLIEQEYTFFKNSDKNSDFYKRAGIVHRLDKETSGILIVAKNNHSFEALQRQFKERKVEKSYIALVHGKMPLGEGEIKVPVGRLPWNRKRFGVLAGGKDAVTKYNVLESGKLLFKKGVGDFLSLLILHPKTGRTHQMRIHLKYINHPIFSDLLYAGRKTARNDRKILQRLFLHALEISFIHPKSNKKVFFKASLPLDLSNLIDLKV